MGKQEIQFTRADAERLIKMETDICYLRKKVGTIISMAKWSAGTIITTCLALLIKVFIL